MEDKVYINGNFIGRQNVLCEIRKCGKIADPVTNKWSHKDGINRKKQIIETKLKQQLPQQRAKTCCFRAANKYLYSYLKYAYMTALNIRQLFGEGELAVLDTYLLSREGAR